MKTCNDKSALTGPNEQIKAQIVKFDTLDEAVAHYKIDEGRSGALDGNGFPFPFNNNIGELFKSSKTLETCILYLI